MRCLVAAGACMLLQAVAASAVVAQAASNGFVVNQEVNVSASAADVFDVLVEQVDRWWDPAHTFSGNSKNLSIDARPGGCFCEALPGGGGVEHLRVVHVAPGRLLRMSGALGPLQGHGLAGSLTWTLTSVEGGTTIRMSYAVGGYMEGGFDQIAPAVEAVLGEQLQRLARFVETGRPTR